MHCGACVRRVTVALQRVEGLEVKAVEVGSAQISVSETAAVKEAVAALDSIGFTARPVAEK
jgi:copper chaperone